MKTFRLLLLSIMMFLVLAQFTQAQSQWGDVLKGAQKALGVGGGLSDSKIVDGLFLMLAEEEKKIRQDPAARVTDLLKEVFGKR
jgi:hypothetical protein